MKMNKKVSDILKGKYHPEGKSFIESLEERKAKYDAMTEEEKKELVFSFKRSYFTNKNRDNCLKDND